MTALKTWVANGMTGGASRNLDAIPTASLADGHRAMTIDSGKFYFHEFDSASTAAESSPTYIRPDDYSSAGVWINIDSPFGNQKLSVPSGRTLTGNVIGFELSRTGDNEITVQAGECFDSANSGILTASTSQTVDTSGETTANEWMYFFICDDDVVRYDVDITGATALSAYDKRFIGAWQNTSAGVLKAGYWLEDTIHFTLSSQCTMASGVQSGTLAQVDISSLMPDGRIINVLYGATSSANAYLGFANQSAGTEISFGATSGSIGDGAKNAWYFVSYGERQPIGWDGTGPYVFDETPAATINIKVQNIKFEV
jgi:hypothetical protein